jgi:hypothetical protein
VAARGTRVASVREGVAVNEKEILALEDKRFGAMIANR